MNCGSQTSQAACRLHPTREGKVYCCEVLDTFSRKIVGRSIDTGQNANLVVNALDMAIKNRDPTPGGVVHASGLPPAWSPVHFVDIHGGFNRSAQ